MSHQWIHIRDHGREALEYMRKRMTGEIKSLKTPWRKLDYELLNGLEWNSVYQLAGSSGTGKTTIKDQLTRGLIDLNPDIDIAILDYQFEMLGRTSVIRDISRFTQKNMKELSSAFEPLSETDFSRISRYVNNELSNYPIYTVETPKSVTSIEIIAKQFYAAVGKPFIATIDHSMLVGKDAEKDDFEIIRRLGQMLIRTKKELPIIWVVLNQLNREYELPGRQLPNSLNAFPTKRDIYGGDSLFFASDGVIVITKPAAFMPQGSWYGPEAYQMRVRENLMVWHILKNRVGEPNTHLAMVADFASMTILENANERPALREARNIFTSANQTIH